MKQEFANTSDGLEVGALMNNKAMSHGGDPADRNRTSINNANRANSDLRPSRINGGQYTRGET